MRHNTTNKFLNGKHQFTLMVNKYLLNHRFTIFYIKNDINLLKKSLKKQEENFMYCEGTPYKILVTPKDGQHTGTVIANIGVLVGFQLNRN